jgi:hypothetical protein
MDYSLHLALRRRFDFGNTLSIQRIMPTVNTGTVAPTLNAIIVDVNTATLYFHKGVIRLGRLGTGFVEPANLAPLLWLHLRCASATFPHT